MSTSQIRLTIRADARDAIRKFRRIRRRLTWMRLRAWISRAGQL